VFTAVNTQAEGRSAFSAPTFAPIPDSLPPPGGHLARILVRNDTGCYAVFSSEAPRRMFSRSFEWDEAKAASNAAKHGVTFSEAKTVFDDPLFVDYYDPDHSDDEHRYIIVGQSRDHRLLIVSYTERGDVIRLISARTTTPEERRAYEGF